MIRLILVILNRSVVFIIMILNKKLLIGIRLRMLFIIISGMMIEFLVRGIRIISR